jgi:hypothetical protein
MKIHWNLTHGEAGIGFHPKRDADPAALLSDGATLAPFCLASWALDRLAASARRLRFEPLEPQTETGVAQDADSCPEIGAGTMFGALARATSGAVSAFLDEPVDFDELALQRYRVSKPGQPFAIGPHRDHKVCRTVVAVWLIYGESGFHVCDRRDGSGARPIAAGPGDLILLRGYGFRGATERPLHFVGALREERLSFGLRVTGGADPMAFGKGGRP